MTKSTDLAPSTAPRLRWGRLWLAIAAAVVVNLLVYAIGSAAGATWIANGQAIAWFLVIIATIVPMVLGALITWLLTRAWAGALAAMAWVGLAFALVTVPAPLLSSDNRPTGLALAAMHVVTGVAWFVAVRPQREQARG